MYLDYFGYFASFVVLISLLMSSITKLRWINLIGAILFTIYAILIKSIPTVFMNFSIALIDIYFLYKIYTSKTYFKILKFNKNSVFFNNFISYNKKDINKFFGKTNFIIDDTKFAFYILKDASPVGIFIGEYLDKETLSIELDFVTKEYRDFKFSKYIYNDNKNIFIKNGIKKIICSINNQEHIKYIRKMGFKKEKENYVYYIN